MIWQDIVISLANIVFALALIPQVIRGFKDKKGYLVLSSSIPTTIGLYVVSITFLSLNLIFSSIISFLVGTVWLTLLIQKLVYK